ncbi:DUF2999 family protein [Gayadomonas joobiniege]|uniref:DUF2999 family protein n=1 Tax=Gayadomonas joobiniege TaxID=1234606 RepID=UPI0003662D0B|nr:DUF2999 family protein [Gayadomonas joobiniege]
MNPILQILREENISDEQIVALFNQLTANPMAAMSTIQSLGLPQEKLQHLMMTVMSNPQLIKDATEELGLDYTKVEAAKAKLAEQGQPK